MGSYLIKRIISLIPILVGISILVFTILHLVPGDPASIMLGTEATPEAVAVLRAEMGLDKPLISQYLHWAGGLLQGDFGVSVHTGEEILPQILKRFLITLQLTIMAVVIGWTLAIPFGILSAIRSHSKTDKVIRILTLLGISVPNFAIGTLLLLGLSLYFNWFPPIDVVHFWDDPAEAFKVFILPAVTMGIVVAAGVMRMTRSAFMETMDKDFIRTARAKGNSQWTVVMGHALRNSSIPIVTIAGMQIGYLLGGSVIVEQLFSIPGLGQYVLDGIYQRDYPVVQGGVLFVALVFVLVNLIIDLIYTWIDPRIKY
ncbi:MULTISPECIES: ABC transporter permease [Brevibacillus]|jgi:peptide/nickel transport system permease protein|uniref:Binding-protein-dependent transporters inner membrane component n=1 Tax=Brevibacillus borstelensis AK1 TaxID=1300222 RepID=M8DHU3_9BACL|nr:ABC transporter permease [Brevibacillus borstelensis]EMT53002.1 binding-protein-dependent transporters inner membrane component [Brevibacillus borstelensis AK1]MBE5397025.1 ABC transporter permease [Brevibacillus borstelensis]MCC0563363.1 ABC transporter permease [Brevibacillus borstelensis]MCM3471374.1 ABC transporter permease [Brevibacillus borstelensis]MCM3558633.1 ABC transporter permease [Brevibacillus borstelensis]